MNEGKPPKGKWWSRPRPQSPAGQESGRDSGREDTEGDFELARPVGAAAVEESAGGPVGTSDGGPQDGDYELSRPVGVSAPATDTDTGVGTETAQAAAGESVAPPAPVAEPASVRERHAESATESATASATESAPPDPADQAADPAESTPLPSATGDRPQPLHDPDPYSTPPYGEPGPWAPAPPVQHPAAVPPTQGTPLATPPPGMPTPVPGTPTPLPPMPTSAAGMPEPTPAMPEPVPGMSTSAPGTPAPAMPEPVPGMSTSAPGTLTPGMQAPAIPAPEPTPATPAPAATMPPVPSTPGAPHPPVPPVAAGEAPAPAPPTAPTPPVLPASPTSPGAPWQRYDPWSTAPLQQTGAAVPTEQQRRKRVRKTLVGGALTLALVSGVLGGVVGVHLERNGGFDGVELPQASAEPTARAADSVAGIAARALPSVVTLHVSGGEESGTGTGFVLDSLGHILTNNHVVEPAGSDGGITVVFNGGQTAEAEIVGGDSGYDLAVVKVSGVKGLKPLNLGNSDNVQVGDPVVAIGAPFDLEGTVTSGIISAKERPITAGGESGDGSDMSYVDALQTDAPINPGNSGGPLLDVRGRVIGINSAIRSAADGADPESGQAGSIGLGFAIPINQGKRVAEELINTGKATHPVIGVTLDMDYAGDGARVGTQGRDGGSPVTPGGPGDRAGIRAGDVITEIDGQRIHSGEELIVKTRAHRPGDRLELTIERDGKERSLSLVLGSSD
ncbi:trypsin-like peptidase domain-containing protein [Streptomyces sp. NPDC014995]|uniref:trypsin-like peptidase domain-containing protein n=1 Tax=Streptomyces sp. NPDC014995 TaxID=3364936 RepID=UPI0037015C37